MIFLKCDDIYNYPVWENSDSERAKFNDQVKNNDLDFYQGNFNYPKENEDLNFKYFPYFGNITRHIRNMDPLNHYLLLINFTLLLLIFIFVLLK